MNLDDIILGEFAENEMRKDFTVSERVAIAKAIEQRLKEKAEARMLAGVKQNPVEKFPQGEGVPGAKSRDIAAERAGFGSGKTYESAKKAVETLPPPLVDALDDGRMSVHLAAQVAIAKAIEQRLAGRLGQNQHTMEIEGKENFPYPTVGQSRDIAAERAGFGAAGHPCTWCTHPCTWCTHPCTWCSPTNR